MTPEQLGQVTAAAKKQGLEGQLIPLASADGASFHGSPLSEADINEMVNNFDRSSPVPVRFGRAKGRGPVIAKVTALQRDGDKMVGKLADVDSRFEELYGSQKLGGRSSRSLAFDRNDEKGKSLVEFGMMPPRVFYGGSWHDGPSTDAALDDLLDAHRGGDCLQFNASDAGRLELVFPEIASSHRQKERRNSAPQTNSAKLHQLTLEYQEGHGGAEKVSYGDALTIVARNNPALTLPDGAARPQSSNETLERLAPEANSVQLHKLAKERQQEKSISYGEALDIATREHPELTLPDGAARSRSREQHPLSGCRFQTNNERLTELAKERQEERNISFAEALAEVVEDNPFLLLPDSAFGPLSPEAVMSSLPLSNSQKLHKAAKELQRKKNLSYGESLSRAAQAHPELTLPDSCSRR